MVLDTHRRLTKICLALPEAGHRGGQHSAYTVRDKKFAYYLDDHHNDGKIALLCKVAPGENSELIAAEPERFYRPAYMAHHGWVALRLDQGKVDWTEVTELVTESYRLVAPKRLAALV